MILTKNNNNKNNNRNFRLKGVRVGCKWACRHDPLPKGENINNANAYPQESKFICKVNGRSPPAMDGYVTCRRKKIYGWDLG